MEPFIYKYTKIVQELIRNSSIDKIITAKNVYQEGRLINKPIIKNVMNELLLHDSRIIGFENLQKLYDLAQSGKSCLLLMQHFSNFDIPNFYELLERQEEKGKKIAQALVSIAGVKLNEENDLVRAFTEAYTRIVIYPSRSFKDIKDKKELEEVKKKRLKINRAAIRQITKLKKKGRIILVFPSGTRYRPWDPKTGRGLKEVYPYIRTFNYMVLVAINGNTLRLNPNGKMEEDLATEDLVIYTISKVYNCKEYRSKVLKSVKFFQDSKQFVIDYIMDELNNMHQNTELERKNFLKNSVRELK